MTQKKNHPTLQRNPTVTKISITTGPSLIIKTISRRHIKQLLYRSFMTKTSHKFFHSKLSNLALGKVCL